MRTIALALLVVALSGRAQGAPVADTPPGEVVVAAEQAAWLNNAGMKRYRARDWAGAAADFRAAIAAQGDHVRAHYNLACVAARAGDRATVLAELRWLAASTQPEAIEKLAKARTDPDLASVAADPEVKALLAPPPGKVRARLGCELPGAEPVPLPDPSFKVLDGVWCRIYVPAGVSGRYTGSLRVVWDGKQGPVHLEPLQAKEAMEVDFGPEQEPCATFTVEGRLLDEQKGVVWQDRLTLKQTCDAPKQLRGASLSCAEEGGAIVCRLPVTDAALPAEARARLEVSWLDAQGATRILVDDGERAAGTPPTFTFRSPAKEGWRRCAPVGLRARVWSDDNQSIFTTRVELKTSCP